MQAVELDPHQWKAVRELHNGAILSGGVGVGKSRVAMQYYVDKEAPKDVFVITTAKKRDSLDWESEGVKQGVSTEAEASRHGTLRVDSWNNLWRYVDVKDAFFIFDEQRLVGSGAWVKVFLKIVKQNNWILLSATPGDTWLDYIPVFVANGLYKNRTEFLREHVVYNTYSKFPKVDRYIGVGRLVRHRNNLLVDMPYQRHTTRVIKDVLVEYDEDLYKKVVKDRWHPYENRPLRDVSELFSVMRKVVNGDVSRLEAVRSLTTLHPKLIVFYNFDYELEILRTLFEEPTTKLEEECPSNQAKSSKSGSALSSSLSSTKPSTSALMSCSIKERPNCQSELASCTTIEKSLGSELMKERSTLTNSTSTQSLSSSPIHRHKILRDGSEETTTTAPDMSISDRKSKSERVVKSFTQSISKDGLRNESASITKDYKDFESCAKKQTGYEAITTSIAEWNGHRHQPIPKTDRWVYLVQYTAGAEGWNCVETDAVIFYSLNYSYRIFEQCQGRIDRLNTPFAELKYYVLKSKSSIDAAIWKVIKTKQNFNEKKHGKSLAETASGMSDIG